MPVCYYQSDPLRSYFHFDRTSGALANHLSAGHIGQEGGQHGPLACKFRSAGFGARAQGIEGF